MEAALCLAIPSERSKLPGIAVGGGCLTPSMAMGSSLVNRINKSDTLSFEVGPLDAETLKKV